MRDSQTAVPVDDQVQEHVAGGRCYERYGSAMDVFHLVVCALYFWSAVGVQLSYWEVIMVGCIPEASAFRLKC